MENHPRYEVLEKIGSGSFATVYRGRDLDLGRDVAIKQIHAQFLAEPQQLERYWQEAQLLASFQHPNIVTIYDIVRDRGWLILELMQGNLAKVAGRKPMDLDSLRSTLAHCLRALKFLHSHGVIHGDIKPSNMMVDRRKRVKIGDFGLARRVSDEEGSLIKGTTKYMAPELVSDEFGAVGPASDLYSLGFAAYELLCGENFESLFPGLSAFGRDRQLAWLMWHAAPDRRLPEIKRVLQDVPDDLALVIQKLTAKHQNERYATADEALADLNIDIRAEKRPDEHGSDAQIDKPPVDNKKRWLLIGAFGLSLVMSLAMLFMPSGGPTAESTPEGEPINVGVIREIDLSRGLIVLENAQGHPTDVPLSDKPRIRLNDDQFILPRELKAGDHVEVRSLNDHADKPHFFFSVLRPQENKGKIKSLSPIDGELVATVEVGAGHEDVTLHTPPRAKLTLNGQSARVGDLRPDDRIDVIHIKDREGRAARQVLRLNAFRLQTVVGYLSSYDADKHRLTLAKRGENAQPVILDVSPKCEVEINGETLKDGKKFGLDDLAVNDRLEIQSDVQAVSIAALRGDHYSGAIQTVVQPGVKFEIQLDSPQGPKTIQTAIGKQTLVTLSGADAGGADLRKFDRVEILKSPDDEELLIAIDAQRPKRQDRMAILIAMQHYEDRRLSVLETPFADAEAIQAALLSRYGVAPERITMIKDPTQIELERQLEDWLNRATNLSQVIVYLTGHAYADDQGRIRVAPQNFQFQKMDQAGIPLVRILEKIDSSPAQDKLLILDCSHAGSGPDLAKQPSTAEMMEAVRTQNASMSLKTVVVLGSSSKGQTGRTLPGHTNSLFAEALAAAYRGAADQNLDLTITPRELFDYVSREMNNRESNDVPPQTPFLLLP